MLVLIGFICLGFVFWRADFSGGGTATFAAKVNGENLSLTEFDRELQARQNQYQQLYRTELSEELRRELRRNVIEAMVRDAVLKQRVDDKGYRVSNERLTQSVRAMSRPTTGSCATPGCRPRGSKRRRASSSRYETFRKASWSPPF